jgi:hypothetical protein
LPPRLHFCQLCGQIAGRTRCRPPGRNFQAKKPGCRAAGWEGTEGGPTEEDLEYACDLKGWSLGHPRQNLQLWRRRPLAGKSR